MDLEPTSQLIPAEPCDEDSFDESPNSYDPASKKRPIRNEIHPKNEEYK